jgi:DNA-binding transcriptional ArsR family regulator
MPTRIDDAGALKALAHPLRVALLAHLVATGPATASACAEAVGSSASNCSWHLRRLAAAGFVEASEAGDGRERPWRATDTGFSVGTFDADPAVRAQQDALIALQLNEEQRLTGAFLDGRAGLPEDWLRAAGQHAYTLALTPEQLAGLREQIDELLRPHIAGAELPEGARRVHVGVRAFPR